MTDSPDHRLPHCPLTDTPCRRTGCAWWGPVLPFVNPAYPDLEVRPGPSGWTKVEAERPLFVEGCRKIGGEVR